MRELYLRESDHPEELSDMYRDQAKEFYELIEKWVRKIMPDSKIVAIVGNDSFMVAVLLNNECEIRSSVIFDRKKNLQSEGNNRNVIAEWLRAVFATDSKWEIKNFEILNEDEFLVFNDMET